MSESNTPRGFARLFSPITIGGVEIPNRIVNTVHATRLSEARELRYLQERARGGAGLIGVQGQLGVASYTVGHPDVSRTPDWDQVPPSPATDEGVAYFDEAAIPRMQRRAELIRAEGVRCFGQVFHQGGAPHAQRMHVPIGPSAVPDPYDALVPYPLHVDEIHEIVRVFAHGVRRVKEAGLDAAEIHAAHGVLLNEFLSPYFNTRDDEWGGPIENRARIIVNILREARAMVGDFPIGVRLGVDGDGATRGLTVAELGEVAAILGPDVDYLSISGGSYAGFDGRAEGAYVSPWYREPGFNAPAAAVVRSRVTVPVIVTGRIADASVAESILADGSADLIGMVRALIADPELPSKVRSGRVNEVRMCLGLSECHYAGEHRTPIQCAVNAAAGREASIEIVPAREPKTVVVVGAGPAGMEAARVAAIRGHRVYLCDARREIGGTVRRLARDPNRRNLLDHTAYFDEQLRRLRVERLLGNPVAAEEVLEFGADAIVLATGAVPVVPELAAGRDHVLTALDVLEAGTAPADRALVVGGLDAHLAGPTIAEYLADLGCEVEFISEQLDFASGAEDATRIVVMDRLVRKGVRVSLSTRLTATDDRGATVRELFSGRERRIADAAVVLACGAAPRTELALQLRGCGTPLYVIGDALAPRRLIHATAEGNRVGSAL